MDKTIELNIEKFEPGVAHLTSLVDQYKDLKIDGLEDKEGYDKVKKARTVLQKQRVEISKIGKSLREDAQQFVKDVIAKEKEYIAIIKPLEESLLEMKEEYEEELEREKNKKKLESRLIILKDNDIEMPEDEIVSYTDMEFQTKINSIQAERIELERQKLDEEKRKMEEEKLRVEREREIEEARRKAAEEAKAKAEADAKLALELAEARRKQDLAEAKAQIEREKQQAIIDERERVRVEQEQKEKAEREEAERIRLEEAKAPERDRIVKWAKQIQDVVHSSPELETELKTAVDEAKHGFVKVLVTLKSRLQ